VPEGGHPVGARLQLDRSPDARVDDGAALSRGRTDKEGLDVLGCPSVVTLVVMVVRKDELARSARAGGLGRDGIGGLGHWPDSLPPAIDRSRGWRPEWCVRSTRIRD
jgi:hypothetical protein